MKTKKSKIETQKQQLDTPVFMHSLNGNVIERYDEIRPIENGFFQNFPGVYCKKCGKTFALYSYSAMQPHGVDENSKPFYNSCFKCDK
jgi:hypothetical protein